MAVAFVFPGQGSQLVGMGKDLYNKFELAQTYYKRADEILGFDLKTISFDGPEEMLKQTYVTQPAIFVHSVILFELLKQNRIHPDMVAGHSLGEYSALVACEAFSFEEGLKLVKLRGQLMKDAGTIEPGTMAAIVGLSPQKITEICEEASAAGVVVPANFNSPQQIAVSGSISGVKRAMELAREAGAKRVIELVVSGAFHSPLMGTATAEMTEALKEVEISPTRCPIVSNVTAQPCSQPAEIQQNLIEQLTHPVRWVESIQAIAAKGTQQFYEIGPGKVLTGLIRRIDRSIQCIPVGTADELAALE